MKSCNVPICILRSNIDVRIRQAELEYALGREELQLLSLVEECRALQARVDKATTKPGTTNSLFNAIQSGTALSLHAVHATVGRWAPCAKVDAAATGLWIEWALDGEGLFRGDRIVEVNGQLCTCRTREELQKLVGIAGRCQLVVVRKRSAPAQQQQLAQSQEDNQRLQHRISYLEDQVKELQDASTKDDAPLPVVMDKQTNVTSISISSPHPSPTGSAERPQIFQRGNYVTTIIGGKATNGVVASATAGGGSRNHITKTMIKDADAAAAAAARRNASAEMHINDNKLLSSSSASKISISSDSSHVKRDHQRYHHQRDKERRDEQQQRDTIRSASHLNLNANHLQYPVNNGGNANNRTNGRYDQQTSGGSGSHPYPAYSSYARSVEHLNYTNG